MAGQVALGRNAAAYYNEDGILIGDAATGALSSDSAQQRVTRWLNMGSTKWFGNVTDVTQNLSSEQADGTTRETAESGFASTIYVLKGATVSFSIRYEYPDPLATKPTFQVQATAAWNNFTPIALAFLDRKRIAPSGGVPEIVVQGFCANFTVSFTKEESLRDVQRFVTEIGHYSLGHFSYETSSGGSFPVPA